MRDEPADLTPDAVRDHVRHGWGLPVDAVRYQPVGAGSYNWTAEAGGRPRWFAGCLRGPHADTADARRQLDALRRYTAVDTRWPALA